MRFELREADASAPDAAGDAAVSDGGVSDGDVPDGDVQTDASTVEDSAVVIADADVVDAEASDATVIADAAAPDAAAPDASAPDAATPDAGPVDVDDDGYTSDVDCDDNDDTVYPGAAEVCDGKDNNCNTVIDDVRGAPAASNQNGVCAGSRQVCAEGGGFEDPDYTTIDGYEAVETSCDGLDNDCDDETDEGLTVALYSDFDRDGYGSGAYDYCTEQRTTLGCAGAVGFSDVIGDCDDSDRNRGPEIAETCDGIDNDCDGFVDEATTSCGSGSLCVEGRCLACTDTLPTLIAEDRAICPNVGTFEIEADVGVLPGVTLAIGAGNRFEFADGRRFYIRGLGGLVVDGTAESPVVFTSASSSPTKTSWEGLVGETSTSDTIQISGAIIEYARTCTGYGARLEDSVVRQCAQAIQYVGSATRTTFESNDSVTNGGTCKFSFSTFEDNDVVFEEFANPIVADSELLGNAVLGTEWSYSRICRSFIHDNEALSGTGTQGYVITDSTIVDNGTGFIVNANTTSAANSVICRNGSGFAVRLGTPNDADFRNNYWCTADESAVGMSMYDVFDGEITLGRIFYSPILMSAPADAPGTW